MIMTLTACSASEAKNGAQEQPTSTEVVEVQEETPEVQEPTQEIVEVATEEVVVESTEETTPEEPQVEVVDFETWAKQEGNDEVCLVVWNEELGIQEIIPTVSVSREVYEIQEGDRLAIPYRECITNFGTKNESTWIWENKEYYELSLPKGEISIVDIVYHDESGETIV